MLFTISMNCSKVCMRSKLEHDKQDCTVHCQDYLVRCVASDAVVEVMNVVSSETHYNSIHHVMCYHVIRSSAAFQTRKCVHAQAAGLCIPKGIYHANFAQYCLTRKCCTCRTAEAAVGDTSVGFCTNGSTAV